MGTQITADRASVLEPSLHFQPISSKQSTIKDMRASRWYLLAALVALLSNSDTTYASRVKLSDPEDSDDGDEPPPSPAGTRVVTMDIQTVYKGADIAVPLTLYWQDAKTYSIGFNAPKAVRKWPESYFVHQMLGVKTKDQHDEEAFKKRLEETVKLPFIFRGYAAGYHNGQPFETVSISKRQLEESKMFFRPENKTDTVFPTYGALKPEEDAADSQDTYLQLSGSEARNYLSTYVSAAGAGVKSEEKKNLRVFQIAVRSVQRWLLPKGLLGEIFEKLSHIGTGSVGILGDPHLVGREKRRAIKHLPLWYNVTNDHTARYVNKVNKFADIAVEKIDMFDEETAEGDETAVAVVANVKATAWKVHQEGPIKGSVTRVDLNAIKSESEKKKEEEEHISNSDDEEQDIIDDNYGFTNLARFIIGRRRKIYY
eukprot:GDKI01043781.1.p1 GENE.GDKI01043781.1~~GDKI01043781.1.p1  ORF type:complete len:427 (-),score=84.89 GDKI01043781.1:46-1326(-)